MTTTDPTVTPVVAEPYLPRHELPADEYRAMGRGLAADLITAQLAAAEANHTLAWLNAHADRWRTQRDVARADAAAWKLRTQLAERDLRVVTGDRDALAADRDDLAAAHSALDRRHQVAIARIRHARRQRDYQAARADRAAGDAARHNTRAAEMESRAAAAAAETAALAAAALAVVHDLEAARRRAGMTGKRVGDLKSLRELRALPAVAAIEASQADR